MYLLINIYISLIFEHSYLWSPEIICWSLDRCGKKKVFSSFGPTAKFFSGAEKAVFLAQIETFSLNKIRTFLHIPAGSFQKLCNI